jgi:gluconolactonase
VTPELPIESFEIFAIEVDHSEWVAFDRGGTLWAGGEVGQIYRIDLQGYVETITTPGGFCGGLAFSPEHELFVCNQPHIQADVCGEDNKIRGAKV